MATYKSFEDMGKSTSAILKRVASAVASGEPLAIESANIDSRNRDGRAAVSALAALAETDKAIVSKRVKAGLAVTVRTGRKRSYSDEDAEKIVRLYDQDTSVPDLARKFNLSVGTIYGILKAKRKTRL
jgi:DNA invertase Pin-like site-specific DNA recombinase